jgi:hypothetical protein
MHYPKLIVRVPECGEAILTTVLIDGQQWPATRVSFDTGATLNGLVRIRLEFIGAIDFESDAPLVITSAEKWPADGTT